MKIAISAEQPLEKEDLKTARFAMAALRTYATRALDLSRSTERSEKEG